MAAAFVAARKKQRHINHVDSTLLDSGTCLHFIPEEKEWVHSGKLDKLVFGSEIEEWKSRQFVLTADKLLLARPSEDVVIDQVPLDEIVYTRAITDGPEESGHGRKKKKKYSMDRLSGAEDIVGDESGAKLNRLEIKTLEDGFNGGRTYVLRAETPEARDFWVQIISTTIEADSDDGHDWPRKLKHWLKAKYDSKPVQAFVAVTILANFACSIISAQINPQEGSDTLYLMESIDYFFTAFFALEVSVNMLANWFHDFFRGDGAGWNIFDLVVVIVSLITIPLDHLPGLSNLRLMRVLRVVRLFEQLQSLRKIVAALTSAIMPVANAFVVLSVITGIYAVVGVSMFREQDPHNFGTFSDSIFTMFQVLTGDGWASSIARPLFEGGSPTFSISIFFISYILIAGTFLFNVVIAVLLDEFITAVAKEKERCIRKADDEALEDVMRKGGALDPFLLYLSDCRTQKELTERINTVYKVMDNDDSGGLSYQELKKGLRKLRLRPQIHFSEEDFDAVTEQGALCNEEGELDLKAFDRIIRAQLKVFMDKQLAIRMSNNQGDLYQSNVLHTLRHILMVLDDGLAVTKDTLTGGTKSLLGGAVHSSPLNSCRPLPSDGSRGFMPRAGSGTSSVNGRNPRGDGGSMEDLARRLSGIEQSLQTLLRRPASPPQRSPPPDLVLPIRSPSTPAIQLSSRSPAIQLSSRGRGVELADAKQGAGLNPSSSFRSFSTPIPNGCQATTAELASPPASPLFMPVAARPASPAWNDASLSDEAPPAIQALRLHGEPTPRNGEPSPPHGERPAGELAPLNSSQASAPSRKSAERGKAPSAAAKAAPALHRKRRSPHQRLRIAAGPPTDRSERSERSERSSSSAPRTARSRPSSPPRAGSRPAPRAEDAAGGREERRGGGGEGGGGGGLGASREEERGLSRPRSPRLWTTQVRPAEELSRAQLCTGCGQCWGGYTGVGCLAKGHPTAMVTDLGPLDQMLAGGFEHGSNRRGDVELRDAKLAEAAEALLSRAVGAGVGGWLHAGGYVDAPAEDGRHLLRCYVKSSETGGEVVGGMDAEAQPGSWMWRTDRERSISRACFGNF